MYEGMVLGNLVITITIRTSSHILYARDAKILLVFKLCRYQEKIRNDNKKNVLL